MTSPRIGRILLRFQLGAGARVALRTLAPVAAAAVAASVMYGSPTLVIGIAKALFFPPTVGLGAAVLATATAMAIASASAPRLTFGLAGWIRHLPAPAISHRRSVTAGLVVVQLPVLVIVLAGGLAALASDAPTTVPRLVGLLPLAWASSLAILRVTRKWARVLAVSAALIAWSGSWPAVLAAVPILIVADAAAGPLVFRAGRRRTARSFRIRSMAGGRRSVILMWVVIAVRALGWRIATSWIGVAISLVPAALFLRNNTLASSHEVAAVRLAGTIAVLLVIATVSESLVKRRPPWPWIRSMPWSAAQRIGLDALLMGVVALPAVAVAAGIHASAVIPLLLTLPLLALRGAAAIRLAPGKITGASGVLLTEGVLVVGLVTLLPWMAAAFLASTPLAVWLAAERERRQDVSRWHELHHLAAGDSVSWSDA